MERYARGFTAAGAAERAIMTPVDWGQARPVFEDMVSVLLSNLNPESQRIDGKGGDGGRDVQIRTDSGLELFELKSFTGRVSNEHNRRGQVERSLERAKSHGPSSWSLVVPIDPSPAELDWFDRLRAKFDFPLYWLGLTWLNEKMAEHVRVRRYFLEDGANEAVRLVKETSEEKAALGRGLTEGLERLRRLAQHLDDVDPYYRIDVSLTNGMQAVDIVPRYVGAELERPIFLTGRISLPENEIGQSVATALRNALRYGDEAHIPPEFTGELSSEDPFGLSEIIPGSPLTFLAGESEEVSFSARIHLRSPDQESLASMPIRFNSRQKGAAGARLFGKDPTGAVEVELLFDLVDRTANVSLRCQQYADMLPGPLLTYLRFAEHLTSPNLFSLTMVGEEIGESRPISIEVAPANAELVDIVTKLDYVQRESSTPFPVPEQFTGQDVLEIERSYRFFKGEIIDFGTSELSFGIHMETEQARESWDSWLQDNALMSLAVVNRGHAFEIAGVEIPTRYAVLVAQPVRIVNPDEMVEQKPWSPEKSVRVRLSIEGEETAKLQRVFGDDPAVGLEQASEMS